MSEQRAPGAPRSGMIPLTVPAMTGDEWNLVKQCFDTNWVSSAGPFVNEFEQRIAERLGVAHAVACVNGTAALHLALLIAGIGQGQEVILPALTFIAPANAVRYVGAHPVFVDIDPTIGQIDSHAVRTFLEQRCERRQDGKILDRMTRRVVTALLPVDILGHPVDIDPLIEIARAYNLILIEDATESLGALYKNQPVGSRADISCLSFNGNKIITTGGGGMLLTNREDWAKKAKYLSTQAKDDPIEFIHCEIGYNYRLTNIQAAMGVAQLRHLDEFIERKREIRQRYLNALRDLEGVTIVGEAPWARSTYWMSVVQCTEIDDDHSRLLMRFLERHAIQSRPLWHPLHTLPIFRSDPPQVLPIAERWYRTTLCLPCSVGLTEIEQESVIEAVKDFCKAL